MTSKPWRLEEQPECPQCGLRVDIRDYNRHVQNCRFDALRKGDPPNMAKAIDDLRTFREKGPYKDFL